MTSMFEKNILEESVLQEKNDIVVSLRNHLMSLYGTIYHYTFGEEDFEIDEAKRKQGVYCSVRRDPKKPKDISGFCFRKDLLSNYLGNGFSFGMEKDELRVYRDVHEFLSKQENVESELKFSRKNPELCLKIGNEESLVIVHIGEGYADEIAVDFMKPSFSNKNFERSKIKMQNG